ncbi:hypothetical protein CCAX7_55000 [Capsulimonas corticalis]|uniref:Uncharacterized protein n=1 Tax=Capsulimonas corticalis TaxID=2219043 RepID=A0A402D5W1_9BACT|nr:hypothetical protein [Capsulimonas corticalis]BDI33449.1 hypothetical protein CCAX7_55000 [Capsulimonas corticalis]
MKIMRVKLENGEMFDIPAEVVARHRADSYAIDEGERGSLAYQKMFDEEFAYTLGSNSELSDWSSNNMNWSDLSLHARRVEVEKPKPDYEDLWAGAEREYLEAPQSAKAVRA